MRARSGRLAAGIMLALALGVLAGCGATAAAGGQAGTAVPVGPADRGYGKAPSYTLTDQNGHRVDSASFAGRVQVVTFLFPYCTTYCPVIRRTLVRFQQQLAAAGKGDDVQLVAFNVDPGGSGPEQMRAFWKQYGGDPADPRFSYLTGTPKQVRHVVTDGFHIYYKKVHGEEEDAGTVPNKVAERAHVDYDITHNDAIEVVDANGTIRHIFTSGSKVTVDQLLQAVDDVS